MDIILFFQSTLRKSWQQKLAGVHMFAQERGWFVQVISLFNSPEEIRNALKEWHPIGCLVDCAMSHSAPTDKIFRDIPTVYLDQDPAYSSLEHPCLLHDSAAEAKLAGAELLKLKCKSYAYIGTGKNLHWDRDRLAQFQKDVRAAGASVAVLPQTGLQEAIVKLPKPCGILGTNDDCAIKAYHAATAAGLAIPDDVAIVGIDNDEMFCEAVSPGLTSAEPDFERAGSRLAQMLAEEIGKREKVRGKREVGREHPFSREKLKKVIGRPQFREGAKLEIELEKGVGVGEMNSSTLPLELKTPTSLRVKIPLADGNPKSRAYAYEVVVSGEESGRNLITSVYDAGCNMGIGREPGVTSLVIPQSELPPGNRLTVTVYPISSLGTRGMAITAEFARG
jgi:DNA-binding LacI/PurR family transcriptional regulator